MSRVRTNPSAQVVSEDLDPHTLLTAKRFDLPAKILYAEWSLRQGAPPAWVRTLYEELVQVFNGAIEPSRSGKRTLRDFTDQFDALIESVRQEGFDPTRSAIPVTEEYEPFDGIHRAAVAITCDRSIRVGRHIGLHFSQHFNYRYFRDRGLAHPWCDEIARTHVRLSPTPGLILLPMAPTDAVIAPADAERVAYQKSFHASHEQLARLANREAAGPAGATSSLSAWFVDPAPGDTLEAFRLRLPGGKGADPSALVVGPGEPLAALADVVLNDNSLFALQHFPPLPPAPALDALRSSPPEPNQTLVFPAAWLRGAPVETVTLVDAGDPRVGDPRQTFHSDGLTFLLPTPEDLATTSVQTAYLQGKTDRARRDARQLRRARRVYRGLRLMRTVFPGWLERWANQVRLRTLLPRNQ